MIEVMCTKCKFMYWPDEMYKGLCGECHRDTRMAFKPLDTLTIRSDLKIGVIYDGDAGERLRFHSGMAEFKGKKVTIRGYVGYGYRIVEDYGIWSWAYDMFEKVGGKKK